MDRLELTRRLMATFHGELEDQLRVLDAELLALEKAETDAQRDERVRNLFRAVHGLKGAARSVGLPLLESVCHRLESMLGTARGGEAPLAPAQLQLLLDAVDAIRDASVRLREERQLGGDSPLEAIAARLAAVVHTAPHLAPRAPPRRLPSVSSSSQIAEPATARVATEKLDLLLNHSGTAAIARARLGAHGATVARVRELAGRCRADRGGHSREPAVARLAHLEKELERLEVGLSADLRTVARTAGELDHEIRRARLVPFAEACQGLERTVRNLARTLEKEVELRIDGGEIDIDRTLAQRLNEPLLHLVRNAVDHGVEPPARRRARGKSLPGSISVAAEARGALVRITVHDDGAGIDLDAVRDNARLRGLPLPADDAEVAQLVLEPGFSTATTVTAVSGRGVGLDAVVGAVEALHGTLRFTTARDLGTRFVLDLPVTLTSARVVLLVAAGQTFAVLNSNVLSLRRIAPDEVMLIAGRETLATAEGPVALLSLARTLGCQGASAPPRAAKRPVVILGAGSQRAAFVVDELLAETEVIVKRLGRRVRRVRGIFASTILSSGKIALIVGAAEVIRVALAAPASGAAARIFVPFDAPAPVTRKRILVVDDSMTTRILEKAILEAAGFEVLLAADGADAWRLLEEGLTCHLVVCDIEMPRLDGFGLTAAIRRTPRLRDLPVILLTGLASDADRARGLEVGANAYLVKSAFDQAQLLETIGREL